MGALSKRVCGNRSSPSKTLSSNSSPLQNPRRSEPSFLSRAPLLPLRVGETMDQNTWRMSINEKKFIETALSSGLRIDGRHPNDYRRLTIKFGREDGSVEVQLGHTHAMGYVTSQLVEPYRDRPNEGTLAIFTEFSPMADPSFEPGRPGEFAIELGRIIDRGLRETKAVDLESLCVVPGKSVWALRLDLHILDNGGNLIDAANIAALASLSTFQRPECSVGGENGQEVTVYEPEARDPIPLTIFHLPVAVTFAFLGEDNVVVDPTYKEEVVMGGRLTATMNSNTDVCAIQRAGGEGVSSDVIMQCLRLASVHAVNITSKIKNAVEAYSKERTLRKVKRHPLAVAHGHGIVDVIMKENDADKFTGHQTQSLGNDSDSKNVSNRVEPGPSQGSEADKVKNSKASIGTPSNWDPYSKTSSLTKSFQASPRPSKLNKEDKGSSLQNPIESAGKIGSSSEPVEASDASHQTNFPRSLKDAVKPKSRKKNRS